MHKSNSDVEFELVPTAFDVAEHRARAKDALAEMHELYAEQYDIIASQEPPKYHTGCQLDWCLNRKAEAALHRGKASTARADAAQIRLDAALVMTSDKADAFFVLCPWPSHAICEDVDMADCIGIGGSVFEVHAGVGSK